jgi:hypothetical protein
MYDYEAHGLRIESEWALPELTLASSTRERDVSVVSGSVDCAARELGSDRDRSENADPYLQATCDRVVLFWPEVGAFEVKEGRCITIDLKAGVEESLMRLPLLGPVLGTLLLQRRRLVLHASAVRIGHGAAAFVGVKGAGKSTTSAALHRRGCPIVADDVLSARVDNEGIQVFPAFPRFKLWPQAAIAALNDDPSALTPLHARVAKRGRSAREGFSTDAVPLRALYILARGESIQVETQNGSRALVDILPHAYNNPLVSKIGSPSLQQWHFEACATIARQTPVRVLRRPYDLDRLPAVADAVIDDVHSLVHP